MVPNDRLFPLSAVEKTPIMKQNRFSFSTSEDELAQQEVQDALAATPEERMAALSTLLDTAYRLWASKLGCEGKSLCRFPRYTQERRYGYRRGP
jgi:hypothetical protein